MLRPSKSIQLVEPSLYYPAMLPRKKKAISEWNPSFCSSPKGQPGELSRGLDMAEKRFQKSQSQPNVSGSSGQLFMEQFLDQ